MKKIIAAGTLILAGFLLVHNVTAGKDVSVNNISAPVVMETSVAAEPSSPAVPPPTVVAQTNPAPKAEPAPSGPAPAALDVKQTPSRGSNPATTAMPVAQPNQIQTPKAQEPIQVQTPSPQEIPAPASVLPDKGTEMLNLINGERTKNGLAPLVLSSQLSGGAVQKSTDMAINEYFNHYSPTYGSPFDMMKSFGIRYRTAGENLARNKNAQAAHEAFMNSAGHRANILNPDFNQIGIGFYQKGTDLFVTQWFTN